MLQPDKCLGYVVGGRYRLTDDLGDGAIGRVFRAEDLDSRYCGLGTPFAGAGRPTAAPSSASAVCVEIAWAADAAGQARLVEALRDWRDLRHDHLLALRDSGVAPAADRALAGAYYLVTEPRAESLRDVLRSGVRPSDESVLHVLRDVTAALSRLHVLGSAYGQLTAAHVIRVGERWKLVPALRQPLMSHRDPTAGGGCGDFEPGPDIRAVAALLTDCLGGRGKMRGTGRPIADLLALPQPWRRLAGLCLQGNCKDNAARVHLETLEALTGAATGASADGLRPPRLLAARDGGAVRLSWTAQPGSEVRLYELADDRAVAWGQVMLAADADCLGRRLAGGQSGSLTVPLDPSRPVRVASVAIAGPAATAGGILKLCWLEDVTKLSGGLESDGRFWLTWRWPAGVSVVEVGLRYDRPPLDAQDPDATWFRWTRSGYDSLGRFECQPAPSSARRVFAAVFAVLPGNDGTSYSAGTFHGAPVLRAAELACSPTC